jgi:hypothetical protein
LLLLGSLDIFGVLDHVSDQRSSHWGARVTSYTSPAELGAYNLSTKSFSRVTTLGKFGSLFGDNIDYNKETNVLYTSTEFLSDDNLVVFSRGIKKR